MQLKLGIVRPTVVFLCCFCAVSGYMCLSAANAEPLKSGEVILDLDRGAGLNGEVKLTMTLQDGRWDGEAWGRATGYNYGQHPGQIVARQGSGGEETLNVNLTVTPDTVGPGGKAEYAVTVKRRDNAFDGKFTGTFCDEPVSGVVRGVIAEALIRPVAGFKPLVQGEHPRMIFRKADMPELKRRMESPEGKAIMAMLTARAPLRLPSQVTDRHSSWMAANWGAVYQLTGDREAASEARRILMEEVVAKKLPDDRDDIQRSPRLLGVALAYDLCFDAWDEAYRRQLAEFIFMTAEDLYRGYLDSVPVVVDRLDPVPWRHRNAVRAACVGAAALAVMNDPGADGKPLRDATRLACAAERDVVEWLRDGVNGAGVGLEGSLQKSLALANGVLAFMQADRTAMGRDLAFVNPMLIAGHVLTSRAAEDGSLKLGISSISVQASGRWPMGFTAVPDSMRGAMRWVFDRDVGLAGKQHFDCAYPYQAAYALANYPFDVPAVEPGVGMPLFVTDLRHGSIVARNRWKDSGDIVAVVEFNAMSLPGLDERAGQQAGVVRISGLGEEWVNGPVGIRPLNGIFGAEMLYAESGRAGQVTAGARLDPAYLTVESAGRAEKPEEWGAAKRTRFVPPSLPATKDAGIRCTRHVAIDYTGAAGVPGLFVIADQLKGAGNRPWLLPAAPRVREQKAGGAQGPSLKWQFVAPSGVQGVHPGSAMPDGLCIAVATLQEGNAPELKVASAADGKASVTIGGQTITFAGDRIVFGK